MVQHLNAFISSFILTLITARLHFGATPSTVSIIASEPARLYRRITHTSALAESES